MNTWFWLHPLRGGVYLVNLTNVCYLTDDGEGHAKVSLSNGEEMIVEESMDYVCETMKKGK